VRSADLAHLAGAWGGAIKRPVAMNDFPSPAFIGVAGLLALLLLAIGPALDGRVGDRCRVDRPLGDETTAACGGQADRCATIRAAGNTAVCPSRPASFRPASASFAHDWNGIQNRALVDHHRAFIPGVGG
jgi:hypothetical protein